MNQKNWESLVKRLRQEARSTLKNNRTDGVAILTVHIVANAEGDAMLWVVGNSKRVEPSGGAASVIRSLVS